MRTRSRAPAPTWLTGVAVSAVVVGGTVAVLGLTAAADARDARSAARLRAETQQEIVTDAEQDLADLRLEIDAAFDEVQLAQTAADGAATTRGGTRHTISVARDRLDEAEASLPTERAQLQALVDALTPVTEATTGYLATARQMMDVRTLQIEAAIGGDFDLFNRTQGDFNGLANTANAALAEFDGVVASIPSATPGRPLTGPVERFVGFEAALTPPTGPAQVEATAADAVPCTPSGVDGCQYFWEVTFTESNWLQATIDRVAIRYNERGGAGYWVSESGEWRDVGIIVPAGGSASYDSWVRTGGTDDMHLIIGGKLKFRYEGTDADGNSISGSITVSLERPTE